MNRRRQIPARNKRDRGFESFFLQRGVYCEPAQRGAKAAGPGRVSSDPAGPQASAGRNASAWPAPCYVPGLVLASRSME